MDMSVVRLPWYAQIGTFLVIGIAATGVFMWYYERPAREGMQSRVAQLTELRGTIAKGLATAKQLPQFRAEVDDLENRLGQLACCPAGRERHGGSVTSDADRGHAVEPDDQELQACSDCYETASCGVADRARARGHVSQPRALFRPRRQVLRASSTSAASM